MPEPGGSFVIGLRSDASIADFILNDARRLELRQELLGLGELT